MLLRLKVLGIKTHNVHCNCFIDRAMDDIIPNNNKEYIYYLLKHNVHKHKMPDSGTVSGSENVLKSEFSNHRNNGDTR